jgi:hypothetical protein
MPGGVEDQAVVPQHQLLLDLGHARLVAGLGGATAAHQRIDEGRLADVGDAADQQAQRLERTGARRRQFAAGGQQGLGRRALGLQRLRTRARQRVEVRQPLRGARRVGQVLLVEQLERGLVLRQLLQQGVAARTRAARIEQFDHHVDAGLHAVADRLPRQVHVTGEPLDAQGTLASRCRRGAAIVRERRWGPAILAPRCPP